MEQRRHTAALLHGAGYAGRELIRLLAMHPDVDLMEVTSRSHAGEAYAKAHPGLRGIVDGTFSAEWTARDVDIVFVAAEHGRGGAAVAGILATGYDGAIIDLSADFRLKDAALYRHIYGVDHPRPDLLDSFTYGLPELEAPYASNAQYIANPGCFATGITLALHPILQRFPDLRVAVTALTGASGSGARAKATTHFPDREGNVRAYSVLSHRHMAEVEQSLGTSGTIAFTPVSGPWTRGIWGTASARLPEGISQMNISDLFIEAYGDSIFVRMAEDELPELLPAANSPFCDIGWIVRGRDLVIGFALDNLLKGAASQAIQNMNLLLRLPEHAGLLPPAMAAHLASTEDYA